MRNRLGLCGMCLWLLSLARTPQVVLLTEQADPTQNGVYEVVLGEADPTMVRVGDPARRGLVVRLGPGWAVSDVPDEHGFFAPVQVIDQRMTEALGDMMAAFGAAVST